MIKINKKVVLTYAWGTPNAGDHALTIGAIELLIQHIPQEHITVISRFANKNDEKDPTSDLKMKYPNITIVESPFKYSRKFFLDRFLEKLHGVFILSGIFLFPKLSLKIFKKNKALDEISNAKLVLCNGGNLFYWNDHRKSLPRLLALSMPFIMAKKLDIPYAFLPQTMGPIENKFLLIFFVNLLNSSQFISFRDTNSLRYMKQYIDERKTEIDLLPDLAFIVSNEYINLKESVRNTLESLGFNRDDKFIAITLRASKLGDPEGLTGGNVDRESIEYVIKYVRDIVVPIAEQHNLNLLVVEQTDVDNETSILFKNLIEKQFSNKIIHVSNRDPLFLSAIYLESECLVGMRLHSLIFALRVHKPAFGIYLKQFGPKTPGIYDSLDLNEYCIDLDEVSTQDACLKLDHMLINKIEIKDKLSNTLIKQINMEHELISRNVNEGC